LLRSDFDLWHEVYILSVLHLAQIGQTARALSAIQELCPRDRWESEIDLKFVTLAGQAILEIGLLRVERTPVGKELVNSVRAGLVQLIESGMLSAKDRAMGGDALADMGDPRFASKLAADLLVPDTAWCEVPAGPFLMGSSKERDHNSFDDEAPQHHVELPYAYRIGRYPVINAQYRHFVEGGGYGDAQYWTEHGWAWREQEKVETSHFWDDSRWSKSNHPVVGVSWYEAVAFANWLSIHLRTAGLLSEDGLVRLLTEAEWEKAARGAMELPSAPVVASLETGLVLADSPSGLVQNPGPARRYPWGDEWDPECANTEESGFEGTAAVGIYPGGTSPYGCLDVSGNVWEWTLSLNFAP
jgi:formylglycine-generating enzyme required for sulfatase activity